jgi:conjugative relaxase-like TrwC/TraI family protein
MVPLSRNPGAIKQYYHEKDPIEKNNGQWFGSGAKKLGLCHGDEIRQKDLNFIVSGYSPDGKKLIQSGSASKDFSSRGTWNLDTKYKKDDLIIYENSDGKEERWVCLRPHISNEKRIPDPQSKHWELFGHRACEEVVVSLPKSASIMGYHVGDKRIIDAHKKAAQKTAKFIEDQLIYARITKNQETNAFKTDNAVIALYDHSTSRENDPQAHTHILVMNMTDTEKGFRAIWNDRIYELQKLIQNVYQSYAAKYIKNLGYEIKSDANGKWEIAGIKQEWIDLFSKRSAKIDQVEAEIKERLSSHMNEAVIRNEAVLSSRPDKDTHMTEDELKSIWENQLSKKEVELAVSKSKNRSDTHLSQSDYIDMACKAIHETESAFKDNHIIDIALRLSRGEYVFEDIEKSFHEALKSGKIKQLSTIKHNQRAKKYVEKLYSTPKMIEIERGIIESIRQGQGKLKPIVSRDIISEYLKKDYGFYKLGQKKAIHAIFDSNTISIIQGKAGTGKTTMLGGAYNILQKEAPEYQMIALAITGKAAEEIETKSGIPSQTIDSFLQLKVSTATIPKIIVIDEVGMLGSEKFSDLIDRAKKENASIVCIGDKNQLLPISAGKIHRDIQEMGLPVILMDEVLRQETPEMEKLVNDIVNYQNLKDPNGITTAISDLYRQGRFIEIKDDNERINAVTEMFMDHYDRDNTLILTGLNNDRKRINETIFKQMQDQGVVNRNTVKIEIKVPVPIVGVKKYFSSSYEIGNYAYVERIGKNFDLKLKPGQEIKIIGVDHSANTILAQSKGKRYTIDCKQDIDLSVYKIEEREFAEGTQIVMTKNDKKFKVKNGQKGEIINISKSGVFHVKIPNQNRFVDLKPDQYSWFDLGWAVTPYKAQGLDANHIIHNANTETSWIHTTEEFYLASSRGKKSYTLFSDSSDIASCFERAQSKASTINTHQTSYPKSKHEYAQRAWENFKYNLSHYGVDQIRVKDLLDPMSKQVIYQMGGLDQARGWKIDYLKENEFIRKYQDLSEQVRVFVIEPNKLSIDPVKEKNLGDIVFGDDVPLKSADDAWNELKSGFQSPGIDKFSKFQQDENIRAVINKMGGWSNIRMWKATALESGSRQEKMFKEIYSNIELQSDQIAWKDVQYNKPKPNFFSVPNQKIPNQVTKVDVKKFEEVRKARGVWLSMPVSEKRLYLSMLNKDGVTNEIDAYRIFLNEYMMKSEPQKVMQQAQYQGMRRI